MAIDKVAIRWSKFHKSLAHFRTMNKTVGQYFHSCGRSSHSNATDWIVVPGHFSTVLLSCLWMPVLEVWRLVYFWSHYIIPFFWSSATLQYWPRKTTRIKYFVGRFLLKLNKDGCCCAGYQCETSILLIKFLSSFKESRIVTRKLRPLTEDLIRATAKPI